MGPLEGVTVVTLEHAIAGPFCTRQLADLGARVIKIERPGSGDFARGYDERVRGLASHFVWTNRSKESLTLDVKHREAGAILARLLSKADVLGDDLLRLIANQQIEESEIAAQVAFCVEHRRGLLLPPEPLHRVGELRAAEFGVVGVAFGPVEAYVVAHVF